MAARNNVASEAQNHDETFETLNPPIEADITNSQLSEGSSSLEPHSPEASPAFHPLEVISASAAQEFRKRDHFSETTQDRSTSHQHVQRPENGVSESTKISSEPNTKAYSMLDDQ
jgi:hypothetical protein